MNYKVLQGNNVDVLKTFPDNHFDSIVTDPPYGIDFLGKEWDATVGSLATYQECLRVLKPGGHILAFSAARTYHHLAIVIEQAGFEIRDQIMWLYSSGFPKSQDVGKSIQRSLGVKKTKKNPNARSRAGDSLYDGGHQKETAGEDVVCTDPAAQEWAGWGTQLKPAHEPIVMARKPLDKNNSIAKNCQQHGVGAINIDATRVAYEDEADRALIVDWKEKWGGNQTGGAPVFQDSNIKKKKKSKSNISIAKNCQDWGVGAINIDATRIPYESEQDKNSIDHKVPTKAWSGHTIQTGSYEQDAFVKVETNELGRFPSNVLGEIKDYQKYFYCPKVSRAERHIGHETPPPMFGDVQGAYGPDGNRMAVGLDARDDENKGNNHPTVKPIELMKYLIKLVTPKGGHVLDPFNGSGSTGCAAVELNYVYTGIELDPKYVEIAEKRIAAWYKHTHNNTFDELFTEEV